MGKRLVEHSLLGAVGVRGIKEETYILNQVHHSSGKTVDGLKVSKRDK